MDSERADDTGDGARGEGRRSIDCLGHARRRRQLAVVAAEPTRVDVDSGAEGITAA